MVHAKAGFKNSIDKWPQISACIKYRNITLLMVKYDNRIWKDYKKRFNFKPEKIRF